MMNLRWLWLDHFPAGMELTDAQRAEVKRRAFEHRFKDPRYRRSSRTFARIAWGFAVPLSLAFMVWVWLLVGVRPPFPWNGIGNVAGILLFQASLWMGIAYGLHRSSVFYVRKALCDMGLPVCIECGYILRGLEKNERCPECGASRGTAKEQT